VGRHLDALDVRPSGGDQVNGVLHEFRRRETRFEADLVLRLGEPQRLAAGRLPDGRALEVVLEATLP
jgi:hypothetical protein